MYHWKSNRGFRKNRHNTWKYRYWQRWVWRKYKFWVRWYSKQRVKLSWMVRRNKLWSMWIWKKYCTY